MITVLVIVVIVVVLLAVGTAWLVLSRRARDEIHSVDGYHQALHTLEEINSRSSASVKLIGSTKANSQPGNDELSSRSDSQIDPSREVPLTSGVDGETVFVFDDISKAVSTGHETFPVSVDQSAVIDSSYSEIDRSRVDNVQDQLRSKGLVDALAPSTKEKRQFSRQRASRSKSSAMRSMDRSPSPLRAPLAAAFIILILIAVLVVIGQHSSSKHSSGNALVQTKTGSRPLKHASKPTRSNHVRSTSATTTTTTTLPPQLLPDPGTVTANSSTYSMSNSSYTVGVSATTGPCWIYLQSSSTTSVLLTLTLSPGEQKSIKVSGTTTLELGAPTVASVNIGGKPAILPTGFQAPFTMTFLVAGSSTTTSPNSSGSAGSTGSAGSAGSAGSTTSST